MAQGHWRSEHWDSSPACHLLCLPGLSPGVPRPLFSHSGAPGFLAFLACCGALSWKLYSSFGILLLDKDAVRGQCRFRTCKSGLCSLRARVCILPAPSAWPHAGSPCVSVASSVQGLVMVADPQGCWSEQRSQYRKAAQCGAWHWEAFDKYFLFWLYYLSEIYTPS